MNAIQTTCPHILRYLTTAVITNKRRRNVTKDLVKVLQQESYTYKDPITEFLEALYVNFDFDGAQVKLRECEKVLMNDFFLVACRDEFIDNARLFIFETYCRIHQCIDIKYVHYLLLLFFYFVYFDSFYNLFYYFYLFQFFLECYQKN